MFKHTQTIRRLLSTNCLSVFDHFVGLVFKGLKFKRMPFCAKPEQRSRKQKDLLPDICFNRIRGLLFFNRNTPVSNNKLKILLDTRMDLSDALSDASSLTARRLPNDFRQWLELCHREYDKEV